MNSVTTVSSSDASQRLHHAEELLRPDSATSAERSSVGENETCSSNGDDDTPNTAQPGSPEAVLVSSSHEDVAPTIELDNGEVITIRQYPHSVSGHHMMLVQDGCIWKATRSHREERFYLSLFESNPHQRLKRSNSIGFMTKVDQSKLGNATQSIRRFVPKFYGIHTLAQQEPPKKPSGASTPSGMPCSTSPIPPEIDSGASSCTPSATTLSTIDANSVRAELQQCEMIVLEDICAGFQRPCILDVKMGRRQYGVNAPPEKIRSKNAKARASTSYEHGIRLAGMKVWDKKANRFKKLDKYECRTLTLETATDELRSSFLANDKALMAAFQERITMLLTVMTAQNTFRFFTSSLLFVYDACNPLQTARVAMVDFAYTYTREELQRAGDPDAQMDTDEGYIVGLHTLRRILEPELGGNPGDESSSPTTGSQ